MHGETIKLLGYVLSLPYTFVISNQRCTVQQRIANWYCFRTKYFAAVVKQKMAYFILLCSISVLLNLLLNIITIIIVFVPCM